MAFAISPKNINNLVYSGSSFYFMPCVEAPRSPTTTDWNYPLFTLWRNSNTMATLPSAEGDMWYLATFTGQGGNNHPLAHWRKLSSGNGGPIIGITVPHGISPILADVNGFVNFTSTTNSIYIDGTDPNSIDFSLPGGGQVIQWLVGDDAVNVGPDATGHVFLPTSVVANSTYATPLWTYNSAANTETIAIALSTASATNNDSSLSGISYYDDSIFTVSIDGYVSLGGGSHPPLQSITGDDTVITYADAAGNINLLTSIVANATNATPLFTTQTAAHTETIELQLSTANLTTNDENYAGACYFDSNSFSVNASGFVEFIGGISNNPNAFQAQLSATVNNVTGDSTEYTVIFDDEIFDTDGNYDPTTGTYTAPVDGIYFFHSNVSIDKVNNALFREGFTQIVTPARTFSGTQMSPYACDSFQGTRHQINLLSSCVCQLTAGDTVYVEAKVGNGPKTIGVAFGAANDPRTTFGGFQITTGGGGGGGGTVSSITGSDGLTVSPDLSGDINLTTLLVNNGTNATPLYTVRTAANTETIEIQKSTASLNGALPNACGVCYFSATDFVVNASGFVEFIGGGGPGGLTNLVGDDTVTVVPDGSNNINLLTSVVPNATNATPILSTSTAANTETIELQLSTADVAGNQALVGLSYFDSVDFDVSVDGFVTFIGAGGTQTISGNDTIAVTPLAGNTELLGSTVANGTNAIPVATINTAAHVESIEVQLSAAVAASDVNVSGLCHFDSSMFGVDGNGFVTLIAGGGGVGPAFQAQISAAVPNFCGDGFVYTIIFDTVNYDASSDYNSGTGVFTAPSAGIYCFHSNALFRDVNNVAYDQAGLFIVTTSETFSGTQLNPYVCRTIALDSVSLMATCICHMDAGDTAYVAVSMANHTKTVELDWGNAADPRTFFAGFKVSGNSTTTTLTGEDAVLVIPDGTGTINLEGSVVANSTNATPVFTKSLAAYNETIEVQLATTSLVEDINLPGLSYYDSDFFTISANGRVQPTEISSFSASVSVAIPNVTGDGTQYNVIFDNVDYDNISDYNNATGVFTAPRDGEYSFSCTLESTGLGVLNTHGIVTFLYNGAFALGGVQSNFGVVRTPGNIYQLSFTSNYLMTAGDTMQVAYAVFGGALVVGVGGTNISRFSGNWISPI